MLYDGKEKWTFINKDGKIISDFIFDETRDFSENLAAVKKDGLWGFIDTNGKQVIDFKYSSVKDFRHGFAIIVNFTGASYYIDQKGNQYGDGYFIAFSFCNNKRAIVKESDGGSYYLIDCNFKKVRKFVTHNAYAEQSMYDVGNEYTFIIENIDNEFLSGKIINLVDINDKSVNWQIYNDFCAYSPEVLIFPYKSENSSVRIFPTNDNNYFFYTIDYSCGEYHELQKSYLTNKNGNIITEISWGKNMFDNGIIYFWDEPGDREYPEDQFRGFYSISNNTKYEKFHRCRSFNDGFCVVVKNNEYNIDDNGNFTNNYGFIDINGNLLGNTINYDQVTSFKNGFAIVVKNEKSGIINTKSELIGNKVWDKADFWGRNHFVCRKDNKFVIVDTNGIEVSQRLDNIGQLSEGYAPVLTGGKIGFINDNGVIIVKSFQFDEVGSFHNGLASARFAGKWGFIDISGKFVIPPQYLEFNQFMVNEGFALVRGNDKIDKNSGWGTPNYFIIDRSGKKIKEIKYER